MCLIQLFLQWPTLQVFLVSKVIKIGFPCTLAQPEKKSQGTVRGTMSHKVTVAIDGPAGSGKSTTARALARSLQYVFVDSGAMYRAVTLKMLESGVSSEDKVQCSVNCPLTFLKAKIIDIAENIDLVLHPSPDKTVILIDGKDRSNAIRDPEV